MIRIGLIDDEVLFLNGLKGLLQNVPDFEVIQTYHNANDLLSYWKRNGCEVEVLLVDIEMPGIGGIELTKLIFEQYPAVKVIGLSSHYSKVLIFEMLKLGASSYLAKNTPFDQLERTISQVQDRGYYSRGLS